MKIPLLSGFYFGSVEHYRLLAQHPRVIMDTGEHHVRQSYRTRTAIVGSSHGGLAAFRTATSHAAPPRVMRLPSESR